MSPFLMPLVDDNNKIGRGYFAPARNQLYIRTRFRQLAISAVKFAGVVLERRLTAIGAIAVFLYIVHELTK